MERRLKNETKNIPKNFGKGIITFIEKHSKMLKKLVIGEGVNFDYFV